MPDQSLPNFPERRMPAKSCLGATKKYRTKIVIGARDEMSRDAEVLVKRVRPVSALPVAVGFGISTPEQVREVWRFADAAVIGSAIVSEIERLGNSPDLVERVGEFTRLLVTAAAALRYTYDIRRLARRQAECPR
jgi:tryptophan synthase alpha chain